MKVEDEAASAAHKKAATKIMGFAHCVLLVLSIDLGGLASSLWQTFLLCGLKAAMIMFLVMSLGSFVLLLCLSELVGIVPFAGGNFGFVRCALGPFWGFLAAAMELLYYNMYNARNLLKVAMLVQAAHAFPPALQPLWAFLGAVVVLLVNLRGGLSFWGPMMAAALFTVAVLLLFYAGAYSHLDLNGYGYGHRYDAQYHNDGFLGDGRRYVSQSFRVTLFYLGLDTLPLCSLRVRDEARVIPRALMTSFGVIFAIAVLATLGVALSRPGIHPTLASAEYVLQFGLADAVSMDPKRYPLLLLPPTIASCIGYLYASGNQLAAMAESGLMPKGLRPRLGADAVPAVALVVSAGLQFLVYLVLHLAAPGDVTFPFNVWSLAAPGLFALICAAFVAFRYKFASMQRTFVSPLGVPGAVFGVALWAHIFVASSDYHFQTDTKAIAAFYGFMTAMVAYYVGFAQFVQFFSPEEQQKFMKAYVLNANQLRRRRGGYYGYMANMWRRTAAVSALFGFGTSRRTNDRSTDAANANATAAASKASTAAPPQPLLSHNKVSAEPFAAASARLSARPPDRKASLRASLTNGSVAVGWSGRALLAEPDSRRVFHLLNPAAAPVEQAAGDEEGTVAAEEEAGAAPGVALLEEYPEHFEPLLTADGAAEGAASAAELAAMVADGGCAFDEALRSAEEV